MLYNNELVVTATCASSRYLTRGAGHPERIAQVGRPVVEVLAHPYLSGEVAELARFGVPGDTTDSDHRLALPGHDELVAVDDPLDDFRKSGLGVAESDNGLRGECSWPDQAGP